MKFNRIETKQCILLEIKNNHEPRIEQIHKSGQHGHFSDPDKNSCAAFVREIQTNAVYNHIRGPRIGAEKKYVKQIYV